MKVFMCNYDGQKGRLVAARSKRQASILTEIPYNHFRTFGHETFNQEDCRLALSTPGVVYEGSLNPGNHNWHPLESRKK